MDVTSLAIQYGWERVPALPNWRTFYRGARFTEFALTGGWTGIHAMLQLYPPDVLVTPTRVLPPTLTPTRTPLPTWTPVPTRTPRPTYTPSNTPTPRATQHPNGHAGAIEHAYRLPHRRSFHEEVLSRSGVERSDCSRIASECRLRYSMISAGMTLFLSSLLASCTPSIPTHGNGIHSNGGDRRRNGNPASGRANAAPQPKPTIAPFRFVLPTPGAEPVSGWRPPLYPVPWAVSAYDHFYFARPIAADNVNWPLAEYRYGGVFFAPNIVHTGVDIDANEGHADPGCRSRHGRLSRLGFVYRSARQYQLIPMDRLWLSAMTLATRDRRSIPIYAHMSKIIAVVGQHVETGDVLGLVGDTGATTGPHLHFEVRLGENTFYSTYNPELWMAPPQGWGVLVGTTDR